MQVFTNALEPMRCQRIHHVKYENTNQQHSDSSDDDDDEDYRADQN